MSRDTSRSEEFPPSRHKDRGSVGPRWCGVFRVEVREARTMHLIRRTLLGASAVGLATSVGVGHSDVLRSACRRRVRAAPDPAVRGGASRREVDRHPAGRRRQHRRARSPPRRTASWLWPPRTTPLRPSRPCPTWRPTPTRTSTRLDRQRRWSGSAGPPDPRCARNERRPDQLRRDEPPGEAAGHRADVGSRRRTVRDGGAVERLRRRRLRPGPGLHRPQGNRADGQRGGDQLADRPAVPERRLGPPEPGHLLRRVHGGSLERHGAGHELDLPRPPGTRCPGRADAEHANERPLASSPADRTPTAGGATTRTPPRSRSRPTPSPPAW